MGINAFIGKANSAGEIEYIYCHNTGAPGEAGQFLTRISPEQCDILLDGGNITSMDGFGTQKQAAHITWCKDYNKPHYAPGQNRKVAISTEAYIEAAIEDVLYAYLLVGKQWKYLNTCARKPGFRPITQQTMYGVGSPQNHHMFDLTTKSRETAAKSGYGSKR